MIPGQKYERDENSAAYVCVCAVHMWVKVEGERRALLLMTASEVRGVNKSSVPHQCSESEASAAVLPPGGALLIRDLC